MNAQTERATAELADMRPSVVATACLVAIMAQGPGHHWVVQAEIESILEREHAAVPVVSSAGALVDALHALGARRIGIVAPYLRELTRLVAGYIEDAGIEVGDAVSLEVSDNQAVAALDPEDLKTHWKRLDLRDCDALVLSACVQMPLAPAIERGRARQRASDAVSRYGNDLGDHAHWSSSQSRRAPARSLAPHPKPSLRRHPDCCFAR